MKVKELLDLLSAKEGNSHIRFKMSHSERVITDIKLTISDVTLIRDLSYSALSISKIIERLRSQGHKDLYFESYLDPIKKIKIESIKSIVCH